MDVQTLSQQLLTFLAPFLPYLIKMGEQAAEEAGEKRGAAAHFCIAGRGGTIEPLHFVGSLSEQLEQRLPGFAEAKRQVLEKEMPGVKIESTVEKRLRDTTNLDCG